MQAENGSSENVAVGIEEKSQPKEAGNRNCGHVYSGRPDPHPTTPGGWVLQLELQEYLGSALQKEFLSCVQGWQ